MNGDLETINNWECCNKEDIEAYDEGFCGIYIGRRDHYNENPDESMVEEEDSCMLI